MVRRRIIRVLLIGLAVVPVACGPRNFANENDALRARVIELEDAVVTLQRHNAELKATVASADLAPDSLPPEARASIPQVTHIKISRLSHTDDTDGDGDPDTLVVYVSSADGLARFVQMAGDLTVHAALLPADREAITIAQTSLGPAQLRAAYRSGFTGTHYTIELPLVLPADAGTFHECDVRVEYIDARTGGRFEAHHAVALR